MPHEWDQFGARMIFLVNWLIEQDCRRGRDVEQSWEGAGLRSDSWSPKGAPESAPWAPVGGKGGRALVPLTPPQGHVGQAGVGPRGVYRRCSP